MIEFLCGDCEARIDHCHGTLVCHLDEYAECSDPDCTDLDPARHELVVDCVTEVDCGCGDPAEQVPRAS